MSPDLLQDLKNEMNTTRNSLNEVKLDVVRMQGKMEGLKASIAELERDQQILERNKVANLAFQPVQKITYGLVGSILIAFLAAVLSLVIPRGPGYDQFKSEKPAEVIIYENINRHREVRESVAPYVGP